MRKAVFVRSKYAWRSYSDFWRLVELSQFETVSATNCDFDRDVLYVFPELDECLMVPLMETPRTRRRARFAFWGLERPDERVPSGVDPGDFFRQAVDEILRFADEMWVSDRFLASLDPRLRLVALGSHPGLARPAPRGPWGVVHLGQTTPRRVRVLDEIARLGIHVSPSSAWGEERDRILAGAACLVAIHRTEGWRLGSPLRTALAAAWGLPLVSETMEDPWPLREGDSVETASVRELPARVARIARDPLSDRSARARGDALHRLLCVETPFGKGVEDALREGATA